MSCATILPAAQVSLCDLVAGYGLKLTVHENGKRDWYANLSPTVQVYDEGTWASDPSWKTAFGFSGQSAKKAIESLCRTLSGSRARVVTREEYQYFGFIRRYRSRVQSIDLSLTTVTHE
jgi:hypothetical protein